ncbi:MAG: cytochrome c oxidase subunit II [Myxococcota bacterium]|nr:cytochrome c oxidase subunit II [Myxococcota bacterium]
MPPFFLDLLALPAEGSTAAGGIDALHLFVISITMVSSTGVFLVAAYFVFRYPRKSETQLTPRIVASMKGESVIIGAILTLFLFWWVVGYRQFVALREPPTDASTVYVTAKQWMWKFTYADGRSANDILTVPLGRPVKLVMTSRDVIHSFYVPGFRNKQDILPGRYTTLWFQPTTPGNYPILCAEYCGVSHSMMRGSVVVLTPADYDQWLSAPTRDASGETDLRSEGARVAQKHECFACHTTTGQRHIGPTWAGLYGSSVTTTDGRRILADEEYLTRSMMEPGTDIVSGYKPVMPAFFGILPQPEVAALVEYIKSLRDAPTESGVRLPALQVTPLAAGDAGAPSAGLPILPRLP